MILWLIGFFAPSTAKGSGLARILQLYWRSYVYHTTRCLVCAATILVAGDLNGQTTMYWDVDGATPGASSGSTASGNWTTSDANWSISSSGNVATQVWDNAASDTAVFAAGTDATGTYTATLGSPISASGLTFEEGTVRISGANALTLSDGMVSVAASRTATIASIVDGSAGLNKTNAGTLVLSGANIFTNGTTISGGTLSGNTIANQSASSAFGWGNFAISNGATLRYTGSTASTNRTISLGSGGGAVAVTSSGTTLMFGGEVSGSDGLTKTGAGTLTLTAANSDSGGTTISAGTLRFANTNSMPSSGTVT